MKISRKSGISQDELINDHILCELPVIITSAISEAQLHVFSPETLRNEFHNIEVQIYDDLFALQTISSVGQYISDNFNQKESSEYLRAYTKFKDIDFFWADELFSCQKEKWNQPACVPISNLILPYCDSNSTKTASHEAFPYKGLFLSGKGGRTRLHRDPLVSNAVLCQFYGTKKITMYSPDQKEFLEVNGDVVDFENPDLEKFPDFNRAQQSYVDELSPGEMVLFPKGWYHHVESLTDSVSVTWNFVLEAEYEHFLSHLESEVSAEELEVVDFFFKKVNSEDSKVQKIKKIIANRHFD